jgi:hypothetical protein
MRLCWVTQRTLWRVGLALILVGAFQLFILQEAPRRPAGPVVTVQEDEPGWNCQTMGNRICGPVAR